MIRASLNVAQTFLEKLTTVDAARFIGPFAGSNGPGMNSGAALDDMIGEALKSKCGKDDITLAEVQRRFNKRLVIIVTELDSGKERQLTPETDPDLPVRVAVRMSMGVPGLMEPFRYNGHVYCDGGMCNDFPMNVLPAGGGRLGLMVRPTNWVAYNLSDVESLVGASALGSSPELKQELEGIKHALQETGLYPVRDPLQLMTTSVNVMMDANLMLQVGRATGLKEMKLSELAPQILTLCCGKLDPFDFSLGKKQHRDLYYAGQLSVHFHASQVDDSAMVMTPEQKLKTVLLVLHLEVLGPHL